MEKNRGCAKPATELTGFPLSPINALDSAMVYHLVYHYSFGIHVNHMVFLQTYLIGCGLIVAIATPASVFPWGIFVLGMLLGSYGVVLAKQASIPYLLALVMAFSLAHVIRKFAFGSYWSEGLSLQDWQIGLIGIGTVLCSFICQLLGHWWFEEFSAPPNLIHGFLAAPVLEGVNLVFKLGMLRELRENVSVQVDLIRERARKKNLG